MKKRNNSMQFETVEYRKPEPPKNKSVNTMITLKSISLFLFCFCIYDFALAQNKMFFSAGISDKWNIGNEKLDTEGTENVISQGGKAYFFSAGIGWSNDPDFLMLSRITYEKFKSELLDWELTSIGSFDANIFRIDPFVWHGRIKQSKFIYDFSLGGINIFTAKTQLIPYSLCYDNGYWYLIDRMNMKNSIGLSFLDVGIGYQVSSHIQIGIETLMIEDETLKVEFVTYSNEIINSKVFSNYGLFPLKFKLTIEI